MRKSRKYFNGADFRDYKQTQKSVDFEFDHSLSHFHAKNEKLNIYPGVAQLGARVVWDHQAAGSIPVTRTKNEPKCRNLGSFLTFDNKLREEKWRLKIF